MSDSLFAPTGYQAPRSGPLSGMDPSADIYKLLLKDRIVFLGAEVSDELDESEEPLGLVVAVLVVPEVFDGERLSVL